MRQVEGSYEGWAALIRYLYLPCEFSPHHPSNPILEAKFKHDRIQDTGYRIQAANGAGMARQQWVALSIAGPPKGCCNARQLQHWLTNGRQSQDKQTKTNSPSPLV